MPPPWVPVPHPEKHPDDFPGKQLIPRSHGLTGPTEGLAMAPHNVAKASVACVCLTEPHWPLRSEKPIRTTVPGHKRAEKHLPVLSG